MWKIAARLSDFPQTAGSGGGACVAGLAPNGPGVGERSRSRISYGCSSSLLPLGRSRPMWIEADRIVGCSES
jgi:hypothetical protein